MSELIDILPSPLLDKASSLGVAHLVKKLDAENYIIYFYKE